MRSIDLAIEYMRKNLIEDAIEILNELIEQDKFHFDAFNLLGICCSMQENQDDAILYFGLAIAINPSIGNFWSNRAESYMAMREYECALSDFEKAIELKYTSEIIYYNMAVCANKIGDLEKAESYGRSSGWKNENNIKILTATYKFQMEIGDHLVAQYNISDIIKEIGDDSLEIIYDHAICFYRLALNEIDDYYVQDPTKEQLEIEFYSHSKDYFDWAIQRLDRLIKLDEHSSKAYALRAECYSKMKQPDLANTDISKAISLDPGNEELYAIWEEIAKFNGNNIPF